VFLPIQVIINAFSGGINMPKSLLGKLVDPQELENAKLSIEDERANLEENINKKIKDILKNGCPGIPREAILKLDSDLMEKSLLESCLYELDQRKQRLNYLMAEMSF
jgi:hypothetical protein